jgi:spore maturation protein CgeB
MIAGLDWNIALAPLVDSSFNRAKSNLRWLETAALGIPCVASNVGHFKETIEHGRDGFLCDKSEDFVPALSRLIEKKSLRKTIGKKAKRKAAMQFTVDNVAKGYADWISRTSNALADEEVEKAMKDLQERENEQGPNQEPSGASCGGPAAEPVCQLLQ